MVRALNAFERLPAYPASRLDYERWTAWSAEQYAAKRVPSMALDAEALDDVQRSRLFVSWRAIIGYWADRRGVAPDDAPLIMFHLLSHAHQAPPFVLLAAERLADACISAGATSTDALFLVATFAWPLRDVDAELSERAWQYIVHAPWQSDPLTQRDLILAVNQHEAWRDGRGLMDLVEARYQAGRLASTRSFLEAIALVQTRRDQIEQITSYRDFLSVELVHGAHQALLRLANLYIELEEEQVYARELLKRAAELTRSRALIFHIERRVWDRPLDEAYAWSEQLTHPRQLDDEIARALKSAQPHHARRLAEAVIIRRYNKLWYGSAVENLPGALERFEREIERMPPADPIGRRAAEHLATLYTRTHHVTQYARSFVRACATSIAFTGKGAELYPIRDELELFFNRSDPYHVLRQESSLMRAREEALSDDEKAASDEVERWFSDRFRPERRTVLDRMARQIVSPMVEVARIAGDIPIIEQACAAAIRTILERGVTIAGDLEPIRERAALIRSQYGHGMKLIEFARDVTRPELVGGALFAGASSLFIPPGLSLAAHAADLGSSLLLTFRAVARIGAVFGRDFQSAEGLHLVADSFALGFSSNEGEGLLSYLSRGDDRALTTITLGGVAYGGSRLVEYLWVAPNAQGDRPSEQFVRHLACLCGFELQQSALVRIIPMIGALISGVSTYAFMKMVTEAAIHVAARDALLLRASSYEKS